MQEQKKVINEKLRALKVPLQFKEETREGIKMLACDICAVLISDDGASVFSSSSSQWLAIVITVIVDTISGCTQAERNDALKAAGLWDGSFTRGKNAKLNNGWHVKASTSKMYGLMLQILKGGEGENG